MLEEFKNYLKSKNYSVATIYEYELNIMQFFKFIETFKNIKISPILIYNIEKNDIIEYLNYLNYYNKNTGVTRKRKFYAIKSFYKWLKVSKNINIDLDNVLLVSTYRKLPHVLNLEQCKKLLSYYKDDRNKLIIYIFLTTGIRISELQNIYIENIKDNKILLKVKGGKNRFITLNKQCKDMIQKYIKNNLNNISTGPLFNIKGKKLSVGGIRYIIYKAYKDLGYEGYTVHSLRHSSATLIYKATNDILVVKEYLGHSSIESTQIYTHIANDEIKKAIESNPLANFQTQK